MKKILLLVCILVMALLFASGCTRSRDVVDNLTAASYSGPSVVNTSSRAPTHTIRVRVVVDASHRREQLRWRARARETIEAASDELRAQFGVAIEVISIEEWDYDGTNQPLEDVLRALASAYPTVATREDRVLAITSSLATPTVAQHELGMAYEHGEHLVLRGMQDHMEQELIEASLDRSKRHLGDAIYHDRITHKRTTVLLHELGHTYGAMHTRDDGQIMSPGYDHKITAFCPINTILLEEAFRLDARLGAAPHLQWKQAMLAELVKLDAQQEPLLSQIPRQEIERAIGREERTRHAATSHDTLLRDAEDATRRGDHEQAWAHLSPLLAEDEQISSRAAYLACFTQHKLASQDHALLELWCTRAIEHAVHLPENVAFAAHVLAIQELERGKTLSAFALVQRLESALQELDETNHERWMAVALLYSASGALSHAERLSALAGMTRDASRLKEAIAYDRHRFSMFDLEPDDEPAIYQIARNLDKALHEDNVPAAEGVMKQLEALAPDTSTALVARCQVAIFKNDSAKMARACEVAAREVPLAAMAHYGLAVSQLVHHDEKAAIASLERSIALAPELEIHWKVLARHYEQRHSKKALEALRRAYSDRHQRDPPW